MNICILENLVSVIWKKAYIIFINKCYHYNLCQWYFEENNNFQSSNSSNMSDNINIDEITSTQHYTRIAQNRFPEQKMLGNDRMETASTEVTSIRRRNYIENSCGDVIDISLILKIEFTSRCPHRIDVIIFTWICLSKSM